MPFFRLHVRLGVFAVAILIQVFIHEWIRTFNKNDEWSISLLAGQ